VRKPTGRPTGRPYITAYDNAVKICAACGGEFRLRDRAFQSFAKFSKRRYCSAECNHLRKRRLGAATFTPNEFFDSNVLKNEQTQCWEWQGKLFVNGYGRFYLGDKELRAHRYSYERHVGPIPEGLMILHSCDNRKCVNPSHLRPGTAKENMADAISRGRVKISTKRAVQ